MLQYSVIAGYTRTKSNPYAKEADVSVCPVHNIVNALCLS